MLKIQTAFVVLFISKELIKIPVKNWYFEIINSEVK